jgi:hypothetical protein
LDRALNGKIVHSLSSNKQRSVPKQSASRASLHTELKEVRLKPPKVRTRKKPLAKSIQPEDPPHELFKNPAIRYMKQSTASDYHEDVHRSER